MKKIVYFLAFTLITSCQKGEKQAKTATSKDTTSVYDTASPSSELTHFATVTTAAASQSRAKKESIDSKSNSLTDKNESEVATEQTDMQPNIVFVPQYTTTSRKIIRTAQVKTKVEQT